MNQILNSGQVVQTESSRLDCQVKEMLGGGSQGEVYKASLGTNFVALKWYFPHYIQSDRGLRRNLEIAIKQGPPSGRFLWPLELASAKGVSGFGYIMPLREGRFKPLIEIMKRRVEPSFRALATAGFELADSYLQLHSKGLCYSDISFGNVSLDPSTGQVCICDNDNVHVDGEPSGIGGTIGFMAPEIVRGKSMPTIDTDLFSLAILLFYIFMMHHPLEGKKELEIKCFDYPAKRKLYGTEPLFIFDPRDDSNRPVAGYHDNAIAFWPIYPSFLRDLFVKSFTSGVKDSKNGRVRESEWRAAMIRLRDSILYCHKCGVENFFEEVRGAGAGSNSGSCWSCKAALNFPYKLLVNRSTVMLNHDSQLFPHHLDPHKIYDFSAPVATVVRHPQDPNIWGLKNISGEKWSSTDLKGSVRDVVPGQSITLSNGRKIIFGKLEGEIRS